MAASSSPFTLLRRLECVLEVRAEVKSQYPDLKERQIKDLLDPQLWRDQWTLLKSGQKLQAALAKKMGAAAIVAGPCHDFNLFEEALETALKVTGVKLDLRERKQLLDAVSWKNPDARAVIKKDSQGEGQIALRSLCGGGQGGRVSGRWRSAR